MVFWMSRKQTFVTLIIAKVKYIVASLVSCEAVWLQKLLVRLF